MPLAPHTYASPCVVDEYLDNFFPADKDTNFGDPPVTYDDMRATARAMLYAALRRHHVLP